MARGTEKRFTCKKCFNYLEMFSKLLWMYSHHFWLMMSPNRQQNVSATPKLGEALYFFAHGGDCFYLESASGLSKAQPLKYVCQLADLICIKLAPQCLGPALLEQDCYIESNRERFRLRNGMPYVGEANDHRTAFMFHISRIWTVAAG